MGDELEEVWANLMVVLVGSEAVGGDGTTEQWRSRNSGEVGLGSGDGPAR